jgi:betaine-aldehyde dehydrogenase
MSVSNIQQLCLFINGQSIAAHSGKYFDVINPSTGEVLTRVADAGLEDVQEAILAGRREFDQGPWRKMTVAERGIYLKRIAQVIRENAKELATLETLSTGKTSKQSTFIDVPTCAEVFEYFGSINDPLKDKTNSVAAPVKSITAFEPVGVVGAIIPWNYPLIMFAWKVAPALIAGNCVVFKPSRLACVSILRLAALIEKIGLPAGVLNIVTTTDHNAAMEIVRSKDVDMISFTGGTETGKEIAQAASQSVKKVSLELGGKSPAIVFADCDFDAALGGVMSSIFMNQGQMCTACSRLLIEDKIYDKFLNALIEKTKKLKIGSADDYQTDFGPVISGEQKDKVLRAIESAVKEGAKLVCGGKSVEIGKGFYIEPTIFVNVENKMKLAQEEIFGPVLAAMKFSDSRSAAEIANDSKYGLAASIWSKDLKKADELARNLQAGLIWINTYGGFYNEASFGGYKQSGHGRELGIEGLLEYTQTKNICIDQTPGGMPLVSSWF